MISELSTVQIPRIRGKKITTRFCFDDCIATYAKFIKCDYELMYLNCWNVSWNQDKNLTMIRSIQTPNNLENDLSEYCGIKINMCNDSFEQVNNTISELRKKNAVIIVFLNSYYCPWDRGYRKYYSEHAFLVEGKDDETNEIICCDPYYEINHGKISYEDFQLGYLYYVTIEKENITLQNDIKILFEKVLKSDNMKEYFIKIREWSDEFADINIVKKELFISPSEIRVDIISILLKIIDKRTCFLILLQYLAKKYECLKQNMEKYEERLIYIIEQWNSCQSIILKGILRNSPEFIVENVPARLNNVIEREEECIDGLISIMKNKNYNNIKKRQVNNLGKEIEIPYLDSNRQKTYCYLNLEPYFNNEGIGYENSVTADLTSANEFILLNSFFVNGILNKNDVSFLISKNNNANDNISCTSQSINVDIGYYKKIMFLGCSEWGSFSDDVIIHYIDGTKDKINLLYLDFVIEDECNNPNNISFKCETVKRIDGENELCDIDHYMYAKVFEINFNKKISSILLPACPCLHIFAISLLRNEDELL